MVDKASLVGPDARVEHLVLVVPDGVKAVCVGVLFLASGKVGLERDDFASVVDDELAGGDGLLCKQTMSLVARLSSALSSQGLPIGS